MSKALLLPALTFAATHALWALCCYRPGFLVCLMGSAMLFGTNVLLAAGGTARGWAPIIADANMLSLLGIFFATVEGMILADKYFVPYQSYFDTATYGNSTAWDAAAGKRDAGGIVFTNTTRPETSMTIDFSCGAAFD